MLSHWVFFAQILISRAYGFPPESLAKFRGPVCKIPWLTAAKSSKFSGLPGPLVCEL